MAASANPLAAAKQALHNADNFGERETGNKKAGDTPPAHEYSKAPYSIVRNKPAGKPKASISDMSDVGAGLKAREDNVNQYLNSSK